MQKTFLPGRIYPNYLKVLVQSCVGKVNTAPCSSWTSRTALDATLALVALASPKFPNAKFPNAKLPQALGSPAKKTSSSCLAIRKKRATPSMPAAVACLVLLVALLLEPKAAMAATFKTNMIQFDPWTRLVAGGDGSKTEGIIVDLLDEFERRSGHKTERTMVPYARVEQNLEQGATDFSLMAWGEARARYAERGSCLVPLSFGVRARKNFHIPDYEALYHIRIGTPRGLKIDPRYNADTRMKKQMVLDYTTGVLMAGLGRDVDAVAGSLSTINYLIVQNNMQDKFGETLVLNTTHLAVAFSRKSPLFAKRHSVNAVFDSMAQDGTARAIYEKWLGQQSQQLIAEAAAPNCQPGK